MVFRGERRGREGLTPPTGEVNIGESVGSTLLMSRNGGGRVEGVRGAEGSPPSLVAEDVLCARGWVLGSKSLEWDKVVVC